MIREIVALLFANGSPPTYVLGVGFVSLPGSIKRHGHRPTPQRGRDHV